MQRAAQPVSGKAHRAFSVQAPGGEGVGRHRARRAAGQTAGAFIDANQADAIDAPTVPARVDDRAVTSAPSVSVALCTYNGAPYLEEQLASLRAQTWQPLEIVAIDDASTDATWDILQRAARSMPALRIHRNPCNLGFAANFERAISLCQGDLIAPCDQDDIWLPTKLETLVRAIGSHTLAYCDSTLVDRNGRSLGERVSDRIRMVQGSDPLAFTFWNCISGHAMLFRRELLAHALPIRDARFHDWWVVFVAASLGSIVYVDQPLVAYRQHERSQTDFMLLRGQRIDRVAKWQVHVDWLRTLSGLSSPHQATFQRMHALASARLHQWFCVEWVRFLHAHAGRLMAMNRRESFGRFAFKQFFGIQWRRYGTRRIR
jgi:glycosyltransferase involved in cell wall biosynthesis